MINLERINKSFDLRYQRDDFTLKEAFVRFLRYSLHWLKFVDLREPPQYENFDQKLEQESSSPIINVLKNISLTIDRGETVAIIGRNGCGKSTLLKLIAGIYFQDSGKMEIDGRISPLIELGAGFHPEFSGRENVFVNGQILGLSKAYLKKRYEEIVEFAGIEQFMDSPVRVYSSGMYMRLAFSVAVNVDPDILLIDEILGVGDSDFQHKCQKKLDEFKSEKKTIILVTHDLDKVRSWATRVIYLKSGEIVFDGPPAEATKIYQKDVDSERQKDDLSDTQIFFSSYPELESSVKWGKVSQVEGQTSEEKMCKILELNPEYPGLHMVFDHRIISIGENLIFRLLNKEETITLFEKNVTLRVSSYESLSNSENEFYKLDCPDLSNLAQEEYHLLVISQTTHHQGIIILKFNLIIHQDENQRGLINLPFKIGVQNDSPV